MILLAAVLQNVLAVKLDIAGARCFILLPCAVLLGIDEDEKIAALYGLFAGMLWDAVSAQHMGFNCIFLMFACYLSAALVVFVFRNTFVYNLVSSTAVIFAYCLVYWLLFVLIGGGEGQGRALAFFYLPSAVYTLCVTPVLYMILNPLKNKLNKKEKIISD